MNTKPSSSIRSALLACALAAAAFLTGWANSPQPAPAGKLYHLGLIWLKEPGNREHRRKISEAAHAFARQIPEVQFLSVGQTLPSGSTYQDDSFDLCLVMRFEDKAAMHRYGRHAVHQEAARDAFLPLSRKITFYDFTSE